MLRLMLAYRVITDMCVEAQALAQGIVMCRNQGLFKVNIEMDSMALTQILKKTMKIP